MGNQNATQDKIKIGNKEYSIGITENKEQYLLTFDKETQKEIKIIFSNEDVEDVTNKVIQALSKQYIERCINNEHKKN